MAVGVLVLHLAFQHVGDGLETAVRMVRRAHRLARAVVHRAHLIQQQEGIEVHEHLGGERTVHDEAAALAGTQAVDGAHDAAGGHGIERPVHDCSEGLSRPLEMGFGIRHFKPGWGSWHCGGRWRTLLPCTEVPPFPC
jgi:hypothetical protein